MHFRFRCYWTPVIEAKPELEPGSVAQPNPATAHLPPAVSAIRARIIAEAFGDAA